MSVSFQSSKNPARRAVGLIDAESAEVARSALARVFPFICGSSAHSDTSDQVFRRHMISHSGVSDHPEMTPSGAVW